MYNYRLINEINVNNKVVFLRLDLNVPIYDGVIKSTKRIDAALPTIKYLLDNNAKIVILSHLGRPKTLDDLSNPSFSLKPIAKILCDKLGDATKSIKFISKSTGQIVEECIKTLEPKSILFLENTRFNDVDSITGEYVKKESSNSPELGKYWASLCDVFVNDAFGTAHRVHASNAGIANYQPNSSIGFLMKHEISTIENIVNNPIKPLTVIFGGAKVSDKINAVERAVQIADYVVLSGGMVYTFLSALGYNMGKCHVEPSYFNLAKELYLKYKNKFILSTDFLCASSVANVNPIRCTLNDSFNNLIALDIGPESLKTIKEVVMKSNTIIWNGPLGVTELPNFAKSTNELALLLGKKTKIGAITLIGGGDSAIAAEHVINANNDLSFTSISTGGGALLYLLSGKEFTSLSKIPESTTEQVDVLVKRYIIEEKYAQKYYDLSQEEQLKKDFKQYADNLYYKNKLINHKKHPSNPMFSNSPIKNVLENDEVKNFEFNYFDPRAVYDQYSYNVDVKNTRKTTIIKENMGTTEEEMLRLQRMKKKGLSKAGLRIKSIVKSQSQELNSIEKTNK